MRWQYSGLFETELKPGAEDLSQYWRKERSMIPVGRMGYRRTAILSGDRLDLEIYPVFGREDEGKARAARTNSTPEKQKALNRKRAEQRIVQLAEANFGKRDVEITLTYRRECTSMERCQMDVRNFLLRVKRYREKRGMEPLKYLYTIEGGREKKSGFGVTRLHCHMMMNGGVDRTVLEEIWSFGYADSKQLQPDEDRGLEELAKYMIKQSKQEGRRYSYSRNLKKPKVKARDVKTSNRAVKAIAKDFMNEAKEEMERVYPAYRFVESRVYFSDQVDGVYIRVVMRRRR